MGLLRYGFLGRPNSYTPFRGYKAGKDRGKKRKGLISMGKTSQRKGRAGELELARLLQDRGYPVEPGRAVSFGGTPDLVGLPGIHIECKRVERLNVPEAMAQAIRDAEKFLDGAPALFHRRNRCPWLVTMKLEDWLELYRGGA